MALAYGEADREFFGTSHGSLLPCTWQECISAERSRLRAIYDDARSQVTVSPRQSYLREGSTR